MKEVRSLYKQGTKSLWLVQPGRCHTLSFCGGVGADHYFWAKINFFATPSAQ